MTEPEKICKHCIYYVNYAFGTGICSYPIISCIKRICESDKCPHWHPKKPVKDKEE